jgi:hypothetical protein
LAVDLIGTRAYSSLHTEKASEAGLATKHFVCGGDDREIDFPLGTPT